MLLGLRERMTNTTCTSVPDGKAFIGLIMLVFILFLLIH